MSRKPEQGEQTSLSETMEVPDRKTASEVQDFSEEVVLEHQAPSVDEIQLSSKELERPPSPQKIIFSKTCITCSKVIYSF